MRPAPSQGVICRGNLRCARHRAPMNVPIWHMAQTPARCTAPNKTCLRLVRPRSRHLCVQSVAQLRLNKPHRLRVWHVCGDPNIQGEAIGRISGRGTCGVENAVRIKSVAGVRMSPQPTVDCRTATVLKRWVVNGAKPAVASEGGGIASLRVVSHYACRNRNSASSGRLEHP